MTSKTKNKTAKPKATRRRDGRVKITAQGQISIPRQVMREAGVKPGDRLQASVDEHGRVIFERDVDALLELIDTVPAGIFAGAAAEIRRMRDEEWER